MARITIATCTDVPEHALDDDHALLAELRGRGHEAALVPWDDAEHDWSQDDLSVVRSTWDYSPRRAEYVAWALSVPRLANPGAVIRWNTDKVYLRELQAAGIPIIPTHWVTPGQPASLPDVEQYVVKPSVSAGAHDSSAYGADQRAAALAHVERITASGRRAMVQPYVRGIDTEGETALLFMNGGYSHGMRKAAILRVDGETLTPSAFMEEMTVREPTPAQRALADRVLDTVPGGRGQLLYARVDLVPDERGEPMLIELEVTEPYLFLSYAEGAVERLASAIEARLPA